MANGPGSRESTREVRIGDEMWTVRVTGAGRLGNGPGPGVPLLSVSVDRLPDADSSAEPRYFVARTLAEVSEDALTGLIESAIRESLEEPGGPDEGHGAGSESGRGREG